MFDHVALGASDLEASVACYSTLLPTLGHEPPARNSMGAEADDFCLSPAGADRPVTRGLHVGFAAPTREAVDAFHRAGLEAGYADDGAPGARPEYAPDYYGAFLRDPDGNSAEAVHLDGLREDGTIDHLWIRVADHDASVAFYVTVGQHAGFTGAAVVPGQRTIFRPDGPGRGSFSIVQADGPVTEPVHLAFPAPAERVRAFHAAAIAAGHRDNGGPGERAVYHPGYYGAFVLDPDGHNVELVDHRRD